MAVIMVIGGIFLLGIGAYVIKTHKEEKHECTCEHCTCGKHDK